ncbi:MAG TPA: metallophosphoesterase [Ilumatobacteraceae bacterium]|nr:metallophosphoesterase [Ilumatobacteraceae bacterium]
MATVLQISDTHFRAEPHAPADRDPDSALSESIAPVLGIAPDLVLLTGDLSDDGSVEALSRLRGMVAVFSAPVLAVAGNHDIVDNVHTVFGAPEMAEVGAWRVLAVETVIPGHEHGAVDVADLIRRLDAVDDRPTVIALHHPPRSTSTHTWFRLIGADELLLELRRRPNVRAIVSGHLHEAFRLHDGDLELCGAPSAYYAIEHLGDTFQLVADGIVGTQVLTLGDDGSFSCDPVDRSLGC